jgi:hypothetical protein
MTRHWMRARSGCCGMIILCGEACGGNVASSTDGGSVHDDAPRDVGSGRDAKLDAGRVDSGTTGPDASPPDTGATNESGALDAGRYPMFPDAAQFDGCAPHSCDGGDLCIESMGPDMVAKPSICSYLPPECGPSPSCLCIVQAVWWCTQPVCSTDGGVTLTCLAPAHP